MVKTYTQYLTDNSLKDNSESDTSWRNEVFKELEKDNICIDNMRKLRNEEVDILLLKIKLGEM